MNAARYKILTIGALIAITVAIHYGWILGPLFGESHWIHAIHSRLCYIPIVIAATWFGLRGGLVAAATISVLILPYIFGTDLGEHNLAAELVEIFFYFAIAFLTGWLIDRELLARRKSEAIRLQFERSQRLSLVGQIAAGVAHEIKNPLASIKGAVEILDGESTSPEEREEFKEIISKEIKRVDNTVKEFLNFARPRETKLEKLNLSDALRSSLKQMETNASAADVDILDTIEDNVMIHADREKIHQVVLNILLNALDASKANSSIDVLLARRPDGKAVLTVRDYGEGIKNEELEKIFEPFYTTKSSGTGLGLAVVKAIIDDHNGDVNIESTPGEGTTVAITLPQYGGTN